MLRLLVAVGAWLVLNADCAWSVRADEPPVAAPAELAAGTSFTNTASDDYLVDVWHTSEGLPMNTIWCICQTRDGYLWFGTGAGLARFDGARFMVFNHANTPELPDNQVLALSEDSYGRLWVGTANGVACLADGHWSAASEARLPGSRLVRGFAEDPAGGMWLGTDSGLIHWREGETRRYGTQEGLPVANVRSLLAETNGTLWVITAAGAAQFRQGSLERVPELERLVGGKELWAIGKDPAGNLWLTGNGLLLRRVGGVWENLGAAPGAPAGNHLALLTARSGDVWLASRNQGVHRWHAGQWSHFTTDDGLAHDDVRSLCEDSEGNVWLATNGGGVNRLKRRHLKVFSTRDGLGRQVISSLVEDAAGTLWVGTDGGGVFRGSSGRFEPFRATPGFTSDVFVWSLCARRDGSLWMGTFSQGLFRYQDGQVTQFTSANGLANNWVPALLETRDGALWAGTYFGDLQRFDGQRFVTVRGGDGVQRRPLCALLETRDGAVWAGTTGDGLLRWWQGSLRTFGPADGLPNEAIAALYQDAEGTLWIGTGGGGLSRWRDGRFVNYSTPQGLPDDFILQILEAADGSLWLGSNNGLIRLPRPALAEVAAGKTKLLAATLYGKRDGLPTPQFSAEHSSLAVRSRNGALWFSLANGVVRVAPPQTGPPAPAPRVLLETILANGQALNPPYRVLAGARALPGEAADGGGPLVVPAGRNKLEFQYTAIDLTGPEKVRFKFMLEGLDAGWEDAGDRRVASYGHVRPGDYRFRVIGCNHEGTWNERGAALRLRVLPYAWETWWFRSAMGLLLLGAVTTGVRQISVRRLRRRIARLEQENRIQQERTRIAQDLHDDLGTSLTEIGFLGSLARSDTGAPPELQHRLDSMVERAARMAKSLDQIVWAVNPANDTLASTANYLCSRAQESLRAAGVKCRLDVADILPPVAINSEVRHHLLLAVNEAINNAMKHAAASEVWLRVHVRESRLEISIEDNGRGFLPQTPANDRNGLRNMRRRLEGIGGRCEIQSSPGQGTRVRFTFPLPD